MRSDVAILESDKTTDDALQGMQEKNARNVLVSVRGEIVGIVSKTDILFKVTSQ
jgi:predicted transcriptional regulator